MEESLPVNNQQSQSRVEELPSRIRSLAKSRNVLVFEKIRKKVHFLRILRICRNRWPSPSRGNHLDGISEATWIADDDNGGESARPRFTKRETKSSTKRRAAAVGLCAGRRPRVRPLWPFISNHRRWFDPLKITSRPASTLSADSRGVVARPTSTADPSDRDTWTARRRRLIFDDWRKVVASSRPVLDSPGGFGGKSIVSHSIAKIRRMHRGYCPLRLSN